jgi:hypothetical protein
MEGRWWRRLADGVHGNGTGQSMNIILLSWRGEHTWRAGQEGNLGSGGAKARASHSIAQHSPKGVTYRVGNGRRVGRLPDQPRAIREGRSNCSCSCTKSTTGLVESQHPHDIIAWHVSFRTGRQQGLQDLTVSSASVKANHSTISMD